MIPRTTRGHRFHETVGIGDESDWLVCEYCGLRTRFPERVAPCEVNRPSPPLLAEAVIDLMNATKEPL